MKYVLAILVLVTTNSFASKGDDIATTMMRSTFKLTAQNKQGTCFIIGKPLKDGRNKSRLVLVTAAHVLEGFEGDSAVIHLRRKDKDTYKRHEHSLIIRKEGKALWVRHPEADVAAMYVSLPEDIDIKIASASLFATDKLLKKFEIRPADKLFALGFPLGQESNKAGFPILRSGTIASYPILPTKQTKDFLFDFEVFDGNSGGPVFMIKRDPVFEGSLRYGKTMRLIIGMVTQQREKIFYTRTPSKESIDKHALKLGIVVHASLIKETVEQLDKN